jgi:hypothetical protein
MLRPKPKDELKLIPCLQRILKLDVMAQLAQRIELRRGGAGRPRRRLLQLRLNRHRDITEPSSLRVPTLLLHLRARLIMPRGRSYHHVVKVTIALPFLPRANLSHIRSADRRQRNCPILRGRRGALPSNLSRPFPEKRLRA